MTSQSTQKPVLTIESLTKYYGKKLALNQVTLRAYAGEVIAVLGKNGAGKTTTIHCALGLHNFDCEHMEILGEVCARSERSLSLKSRIGVMMQVGSANANLTVFEQLDLFCSYYPDGYTPAELIEIFSLQAIAHQRFGKLSGGQRQQVLFALALAGKPDLLFLDEPTVGMDIEARHLLWRQINALKEQGCAIVLTTHYIEEAERLADRVAIIHNGQVMQQDTLAAVIGDKQSLEEAYLSFIQEQSHGSH